MEKRYSLSECLKGYYKMFRKMTLKVKIIIFTILAVIGLFIIVQTAIDNNEQQKQLKEQFENKIVIAEKNNQQLKLINEKKEEEKIIIEEQKNIQDAREEKYNRAFQLYSKEEKYTEAIRLMDEIITEDETFYKAYNLKGIALCYLGAARGDGGRFEDGIASINKALEIKPDYGYAAFTLAEAYDLYAHYDNAIEWYNKAISIEPAYAWSYYGLAKTYSRTNDSINALSNLSKAIELDNSIKSCASTDGVFSNIKNSEKFKTLVGN
jgi:tetratricopeptide (TPR) repeat protein